MRFLSHAFIYLRSSTAYCMNETVNPLVSLASVYWRCPTEIFCFLQPVSAVNLSKFPRKYSLPSVEEWDQDALRLNEKHKNPWMLHSTLLSAYWKHWDVCVKITLFNPTFPKLIWIQSPIHSTHPWKSC